MGKKIRSYSIFVLFLLMSMSVFAGWGNGRGHGNKNKNKNNKQGDELNGNKDWVEKVENKIKIDLTNYPEIILELKGNKKGKYAINFKEKQEKTLDYRWYGIKNIERKDEKWVIIYTSLLHVLPGNKVEVSFDAVNGNGKNKKKVTGRYTVPGFPENEGGKIDIKTYEEVKQPNKPEIRKGEYVFTKGGKVSNISNPAIYAVVPKDKKIKKLKIETLDSIGNITGTKEMNLSKKTGNIEIESNYFNYIENGAYRVKITPISEVKNKHKDDVEGESKILNFIVDTKIKNSYLEKEEIISELEMKDGKPVIKIKLSKFEELSGINKYSYTLSNGFQKKEEEVSVKGGKYLIPTEENGLADIKIPLGDFSEGSRLTLSFEVYDRVGNKKTYEKTYFIPKQANKIIAKISGDVKQRNSRIKIVTEGNKDKFGIGSSVDGSSEWSSED